MFDNDGSLSEPVQRQFHSFFEAFKSHVWLSVDHKKLLEERNETIPLLTELSGLGSLLQHFLPTALAGPFQPTELFDENR